MWAEILARTVNRKEMIYIKSIYEQLLEKGLAYKCYCTPEELEAEREAQSAKSEMPSIVGNVVT